MCQDYTTHPLPTYTHTHRSVMVRLAKTSDIEQIEVLSQGIDGSDHLINDVKQYLTARRDPTKQVRTCIL